MCTDASMAAVQTRLYCSVKTSRPPGQRNALVSANELQLLVDSLDRGEWDARFAWFAVQKPSRPQHLLAARETLEFWRDQLARAVLCDLQGSLRAVARVIAESK